MSKIADGIVRFRWPIILGFLALAVVFGLQIPKAEINSDMKSQLPPGMESRVNADAIDEIFGGTEMLMRTRRGITPGPSAFSVYGTTIRTCRGFRYLAF